MTAQAMIQEAMADALQAVPTSLEILCDMYSLSHQQLADVMGEKRTWVQERVSGRTKVSHADLKGFAVTFNVDPDVLFWADRFRIAGYVADHPSDVLLNEAFRRSGCTPGLVSTPA